MTVKRLTALTLMAIAGAVATARLALADSSAKLSGRIGVDNAYFLKDKRLRHNRYELHLKQVASYSSRLSSTIEGRFRYDAAVMNNRHAPYHDLAPEVRDDEMAEAEMRQLYLDYLGDSFRLTVGLQQIDWIDTLSPLGNDGMTPIDLRYGGFGDGSEVIVPVGALRVNHKFLIGSLDWLLVPRPEHSRLPKGPNGYGIAESVASSAGSGDSFITKETPRVASAAEAGVRYLLTGDGWELTFMGYHGHQKTPVLATEQSGLAPNPLNPTGPASVPTFATESSYPLSPTYGIFSAFSGDAWVLRLMALHEPSRTPARTVRRPVIPPLASQDNDKEPREVRSKGGFGFDYVFSRHLKFYSEHYLTRTSIVEENPQIDVAVNGAVYEDPTNDYTSTIRLTNESFDDVLLAVDAIFAGPKKSQILIPHATWTFAENYELEVGARLVKSSDEASRYESLKDASQVYASLFRHFSVAE